MPHIGSSLRITSPNYRGSTTRNLDIYQSRMGDVQADKAYEPEAIMFANAVKLFSINNFDIKIAPGWVLIAALITWSLSHQYFPQILPNAPPAVHLTMAICTMLGLFASLLLHELAHSVIARHLGIEIKSITLFLFGGVAEMTQEPRSARAEFWIAVAGPAMSFCLAFGFWIIGAFAVGTNASEAVIAVLSYLGAVNLVLALFNLLPAFPLDGGRVLRAVIWHQTDDALKATRMATQSGTILAYVLMWLGVMALFRGAVISGLWTILIGTFVLLAARASLAQHLLKYASDGRTVRSFMTHNPTTVSPDAMLSDVIHDIVLGARKSFVPVTETGVLLGYIDMSVIANIDRENWANTRVGDVFVGLDPAVMLEPDLAISQVTDIITQTGRRKFMVVKDHDLLGVLTIADLARVMTTQTQNTSTSVKHSKIEK
ncbi:site-2 protease family protein [Thalassobacter stenotrophicus]|nr:site-2 protease family protein [Thalassobacter stenotrophicus]